MNERTLDYVPITGLGVDALEARKERPGNVTEEQVDAKMRARLDRLRAATPDARLGQSKKWSHIEAGVGTLISFIVGVMGNIILLPLIISELGVGIIAAVTLTLGFMILSYVRQYSLRRFFNWMHVKDQ